MRQTDSRCAVLFALLVSFLAACATVEPAVTSSAPAAPESKVKASPYKPGSVISWRDVDMPEFSFTETVMATGEDYVILRDDNYDPSLTDDDTIPEFYVVFSGLFFSECPAAATFSQADRKQLQQLLSSATAKVSVTDVVEGDVYTYERSDPSVIQTGNGQEEAAGFIETSMVDGDDGTNTLYYLATDDHEVLGWDRGEDERVRLLTVTDKTPNTAHIQRAKSVCPIKPLVD